MALDEWQFKVGGLVMGTGTPFNISDVLGMGLGDKRDRRYDIPGEDGVVWGREFRNGPTVTLEGHYERATPALAYADVLTLRAAFSGAGRTTPRSTEPFTYRWPGAVEQTVQGRAVGVSISVTDLVFGRVFFTGVFECKTQLT